MYYIFKKVYCFSICYNKTFHNILITKISCLQLNFIKAMTWQDIRSQFYIGGPTDPHPLGTRS